MKKVIMKMLLFSNLLFTQQMVLAQTAWSHVYTEFPYTRLFCVSETTEGDFVTAGDGMKGVFCMKVNSEGNVNWEKGYQVGGGNFGASEMLIDSIGNIFLAGDGQDLNNHNVFGFLMGLDSNGDSLFTKYYPQNGWSFIDGFIEGYDSSFVIVGSADTDSVEHNTDIWLFAVNRRGELLWQKFYDEEEYEYGRDVVKTLDGGYIILAELADLHNAMKVIKTDRIGNVEWNKTFRYDESTLQPNGIIATLDEGYLVVGKIDRESFLLNLSFEGNINWEKRFNWPVKEDVEQTNSSGSAMAVIQNINRSYTIVGQHSGGYGWGPDYESIEAVYLYTISDNGDSLWRRSYEANLWPAVYDFRGTSDGGFIIPAYMFTWDDPSLAWLIKTDNEGGIVSIHSDEIELGEPENYSLHQNYPNPFNPSTKIKYSIPVADAYYASTTMVTLRVYDVLGKDVATLVNKEQSAGSYEVEFDANNLTSGVYFYRIRTSNFVETKKMILLR